MSGIIGKGALPAQVMEGRNFDSAGKEEEDIPMGFKEREALQMKKLLAQYGNTTEGKRQVARQMGISLATLYRRIRKMK